MIFRLDSWATPDRRCYFGLTEGIVFAAVGGAALGAGTAAATGGDPGKGAEFGAITGGVTAGAGPLVSEATGLGATASGALAGAGAGALASGITGTDPLIGTLSGGAVGALTGALSPSAAPAATDVGSTAPLPTTGAGGAGAGGVLSPTAATALSEQTPELVAAGGSATGTAATPTTALGTLSGTTPSAAAPDALQGELTAEGVNAAGTNAAAVAPAATGPNAATTTAVNNALGVPAPSFGSQVGSALTGRTAATLALAGAPVALAALRGQPSVPSAAQPLTPGGSVTAPLIATEAANLNAANTGNITPPQQSQIDTFINQQRDNLFQSLANEGVGDPTKDSRFIQGMADIQRQALGMVQSFLSTDLTQGLAAAGEASTALNQAATMQINLDNQYQTALDSAMSSFGLIAGLSSLNRAA